MRIDDTNAQVGISGFARPATYVLLNLRYFDGESSEWFDSRHLPNPKRPWYIRIKIIPIAWSKHSC